MPMGEHDRHRSAQAVPDELGTGLPLVASRAATLAACSSRVYV